MSGRIDPYCAELLERYAKAIRDGQVEKLEIIFTPYYDVDSEDNEIVTRRVTVNLEFREAQVRAE